MRLHRSAGLALLLIFLAAHLALLPKTLEDLDSVNFAMGVREFDVARHQPHPPGYPVYIALGKISTGVLRVAGIDAAAPRGLAIWSAVAGAAALPAVFLFFRRLEGRDGLAWWATVIVGASPLFWFSAHRPLSDMAGFAGAMWALALLAGPGAGREPLIGAFIGGLAIGIRLQPAALTIPMLVFAAVRRRDARAAASMVGAFTLGVIAWVAPLIVASGGPSAYAQALGAQAGEDFSGVVMLWTHRQVRVAIHAVVNTFVWPWDWWLGAAVCVLAAAGALRLAWRAPRVLAMLLALFGPYAVFHLLFHETETTRYALPLLPVVAYAAMAAVEGLPARALPVSAIAIAGMSLMLAVPASFRYAREGAPVFRAFDDMAATAHGGDPVNAIALHAQMRRASEWASPILPARVERAPHGREWLRLVSLWRTEPSARVWFVADPGRTDLALIDARARDLARAYRWGFVEPPLVGGARPDAVDWYRMRPPNWMLDRGWSVTAETGGVTARERQGPHLAPAIAWLKRQAPETMVVLGGRNLSAAEVTLAVALPGAAIERYAIPPGFFVRHLTLPAGALNTGTPYLPLEVRSESGPDRAVSLEQFDAQPPGVPMFAFGPGWQEPEFNRDFGRGWRWMSEKSELWVRPVGRAVTLRLSGESPLRYFDAAPRVRVLVGDREVAAFDPAGDFDEPIELPADLLRNASGRVVLESSKFFVPGGPGGGDQRHLALRVFSVSVD